MTDQARQYRTGHRCPHCRQVHMYSDLSKGEILARNLPCAADWYQPDGSPVITDARKRTLCQSCGRPWLPSKHQLEEQA